MPVPLAATPINGQETALPADVQVRPVADEVGETEDVQPTLMGRSDLSPAPSAQGSGTVDPDAITAVHGFVIDHEDATLAGPLSHGPQQPAASAWPVGSTTPVAEGSAGLVSTPPAAAPQRHPSLPPYLPPAARPPARPAPPFVAIWEPTQQRGASMLAFDANAAAALSYLFWWVSGLVVYFNERENRYVRFHAVQSILWTGILTVFAVLAFMSGAIFDDLTQLTGLPIYHTLGTATDALAVCIIVFCWLAPMVAGWSGHYLRLPVVGAYAERYSAPLARTPHD